VELTLQRKVLSVGTHFMEGVTLWGMNSLYRGTESVGTHFMERVTVYRNSLYR